MGLGYVQVYFLLGCVRNFWVGNVTSYPIEACVPKFGDLVLCNRG